MLKESRGIAQRSSNIREAAALKAALADTDFARVFICTWLRQATEAESVRVNGEKKRGAQPFSDQHFVSSRLATLVNTQNRPPRERS